MQQCLWYEDVTQKSKYLENGTLFSLPIKKNIHYTSMAKTCQKIYFSSWDNPSNYTSLHLQKLHNHFWHLSYNEVEDYSIQTMERGGL